MAIIKGTESNNVLYDTSGADTIYGYGGDDFIGIGGGVDTGGDTGGVGDVIYGGLGDDTLSLNYSSVSGPYSFSYQEIEHIGFIGTAFGYARLWPCKTQECRKSQTSA